MGNPNTAPVTDSTQIHTEPQYSLARILGIWGAATVPMAVLGWIVAPAVAPDLEENPIGAAAIRIGLLTFGLIWQFLLTLILVYREEGDLHWATIRRRLWLRGPSNPRTGERRGRLWLWVLPFLMAVALVEIVLAGPIVDLWVSVLPFLAAPPGFDAGEVLGSATVQAQLGGAWWFLSLMAVFATFTHIPG